jgi:hypothetical protein
MSIDTLASIVGKVQQRVGTLPDIFMLEDAVGNKWRDIQARIPWTWRRKQAEFYFYAPVTTGTVTLTRGYDIATFSSAIVAPALIGRQLRVNGTNTPIRTLIGMIDSTHAYLDRNWSYVDQAGVGFEIYQAYVEVPTDFDSFLSVIDPQRGFQLDYWSHTADELDRVDARRAYGGNIAYWIVLKDYASDRRGIVSSVVQARGSGFVPLSSGEFTGAADALFTIEITGASTFKWKRDGGAYISGVAMDPAGEPQALSDGVLVSFPPLAYTLGDVFSIRCGAAEAPGGPRYEPWPHIRADETRPYLYLANLPDLSDPGAMLPRYVRGDVIMEMVLADVARWKHPDNAYYDLKLALIHDQRAESMLLDMERQDQARETTDLAYTNWNDLPAYDSEFIASHDTGYEINTL